MTDNTCSICLEPLFSKSNCSNIGTAVPCGHCFHNDCFSRWKVSRRFHRAKCPCPNCNVGTDNFIKIFISCDEEGNEETSTSKNDLNKQVGGKSTSSTSTGPEVSTRSAQRSNANRSDLYFPMSVGSQLCRLRNESRHIVDLDHSSIVHNYSSARTPARSSSAHARTNESSIITRPLERSFSAASPQRLRQRHQQSKFVKDLNVAQKAIAKNLLDHKSAVLSIGTLTQKQQAKRIHKLKTSQQRLSSQLSDHKEALQLLSPENLRRKEKEIVQVLKRELAILIDDSREQRLVIHSIYSGKIAQEQSRAARMKEDQQRLKATLLDFGAVMKTLRSSGEQPKGLRKLQREQQDLCRKVHSLGEPIRSMNVDTLQREHLKRTDQLERDLQGLSKRVSDHGSAIQSLCSV